ncbi:MAG TPA: hypothetical protein VET88_06410 [Gammaproteobacteria bacterium]|nr:hypothetical protein [Gammaproteobacteria bacterium]
MTTNYFLTFLAGVTVAAGFQSAIAGQDIPPYYDEDTDTVIYNFVGGPVVSDSSRVPVRSAHGISPYYDEDTDTVAYHFAGKPFEPVQANASRPAPGRITPYYDEETDTVVYSFVEHQPRQTTAMADTP